MNELESENFLDQYRSSLVGKKYFYYESLDSTNKKLRELTSHVDLKHMGTHETKGGWEGTVVVAGSQSGGRGRLERQWCSPPGGLWFSVFLKPRPENITLLPLLAGAAVADTLNWFGLNAGIKWPNDVLVNGKKICGILVEGDKDGAIVGIGVNANFFVKDLPDDLKVSATTIQEELEDEVDLPQLLAKILEAIEEFYVLYREGEYNDILASWRSRSVTLGRMVKVQTPGGEIVGEAVSIDNTGALILRKDGKEFTVLAGDCIHLR